MKQAAPAFTMTTVERLDGRVAIVTGAGRGLGREHALYLASQGARVVVNDLGADVHGEGTDAAPAQQVVDEINALGGRAVISGHNVADWEQAGELVHLALATFGDLHVLVNNAGILRDRTLANMAQEEWDAVVSVHLRGHAATSRHALAYWREQSKAGAEVKASIVHTSSNAGFAGGFGQANYSAAKLAVLALSRVISLEARRYGVRSNAISPSARTRILMSVPGAADDPNISPPAGGFDMLDPANVSPLVGWLAQADCPADSQIFHVYGNRLLVISMPQIVHELTTQGRWTPEALDAALDGKLLTPPSVDDFTPL